MRGQGIVPWRDGRCAGRGVLVDDMSSRLVLLAATEYGRHNTERRLLFTSLMSAVA